MLHSVTLLEVLFHALESDSPTRSLHSTSKFRVQNGIYRRDGFLGQICCVRKGRGFNPLLKAAPSRLLDSLSYGLCIDFRSSGCHPAPRNEAGISGQRLAKLFSGVLDALTSSLHNRSSSNSSLSRGLTHCIEKSVFYGFRLHGVGEDQARDLLHCTTT